MTIDRVFAITFFRDFAAKNKIEQSVTLERLAERIRRTSAAKKDALPWLKFARFGSLPNPKSAHGSLRWNGNVLRLSGVVVDYDDEKITPEEAAEKLDKAGIDALVYTSPSHLREGRGPRWRIGCPFSHELSPDRHHQMVARLNGLFGGVLALESFTLSQAYFYGSVDHNPFHRVILVDGTSTLDACSELDITAVGKPNSHGAHVSGEPEAATEDIRAALAAIPNPVPSWDPKAGWVEWNNLGMAIWRASGGSDESFEVFDKWSQQSPKYDSDETEFRWRHYYTSPPSKVGFGTLVHLARESQPQWKKPSAQSTKPNGLDDFDARLPPSEAELNAPQRRPPLIFIDPITLQDKPVPQRQWLVRDWMPWRRVIGLYGAGGDGKTLLAQMLLTATALGRPWLGLPAQRIKAIGVFCEDDEEELHERQADINKLYCCDFTDLENMKWLPRLGCDNVLMTFDAGRPRLTDFWHELLAEAQVFGAQLIVLDTLSDFFSGNEIDRTQVRHFGQFALGGLARAIDGPVLGLAHPSQAGVRSGSGESGSTGWDAVFRSRLYLTRPKVEEGEDGDPFARILTAKKPIGRAATTKSDCAGPKASSSTKTHRQASLARSNAANAATSFWTYSTTCSPMTATSRPIAAPAIMRRRFPSTAPIARVTRLSISRERWRDSLRTKKSLSDATVAMVTTTSKSSAPRQQIVVRQWMATAQK